METMLRDWDGETVITHYDRPTGAWILIAIHSTRRGPAGGGTRMKQYSSVEAAMADALKLAAGMTFKFATANAAMGGGKAVIALPADFDLRERDGLLRRYGALVHQLGGLYYTGPDVGTSSADMDIIAETGAPYVFARTPQAGGAGDSGPITGLGVFHAVRTTCERVFGEPSVEGREILVQGAGSVGRTLIGLLCEAGAKVRFSDVDGNAVAAVRERWGIEAVPPEMVLSSPCDVFSPCALGGILNAETIAGLRCRAVAGAANNQLATPEDAERLRERDILYAPDFICNLGGAMGITGIEALGWSREEAQARVIESITGTLRQVFEYAAREGISTDAAAKEIVRQRLDAR